MTTAVNQRGFGPANTLQPKESPMAEQTFSDITFKVHVSGHISKSQSEHVSNAIEQAVLDMIDSGEWTCLQDVHVSVQDGTPVVRAKVT
jgi:hypothetical protein